MTKEDVDLSTVLQISAQTIDGWYPYFRCIITAAPTQDVLLTPTTDVVLDEYRSELCLLVLVPVVLGFTRYKYGGTRPKVNVRRLVSGKTTFSEILYP